MYQSDFLNMRYPKEKYAVVLNKEIFEIEIIKKNQNGDLELVFTLKKTQVKFTSCL